MNNIVGIATSWVGRRIQQRSDEVRGDPDVEATRLAALASLLFISAVTETAVTGHLINYIAD